MERPFSAESLKTFYIERLGSISARKDLETALREGKINLTLDINELVMSERRAEILRSNPDSIEILGINRQVQYGYDDWNKKFTASVKLPAAEIFKLAEVPLLPSGRNITFEIVSKEGENYTQFFGTNLEELKQKSRQFLIKKAWDKWRHSGEAPQDQRLENFDPFGELPILPEPVLFGIDPETGEPLLSYPAITVESYYCSGNKYTIKFFPSLEEAKQAQSRAFEIIGQAKIEQRKEEEKKRLLTSARELLQKVKRDFNTIDYLYGDFGLSYDEKNNIGNQLLEAERKLRSNTEEVLKILQSLDERVTQALNYKEQKRLAKEGADAAISEHYNTCPLCGRVIENWKCSNSEHDAERIDYALDEKGNETGPAILSQIVTDQGKIVAQLRCSNNEGRRRYRHYRGEIYLVTGSDIGENAWQGELFKSLRFEDFGKIIAPEQVQEKKQKLEAMRQKKKMAEARARYQEELKYARQQVEHGHWKRGKFNKGAHPKTGEEQWELTLKGKGLIVKYIIDRGSKQPSVENLEYFYSDGEILVDTRGFRLIIARLENPFPEDKPEESELPITSVETEPPSQKPLTESLEELKKKWNAK